MYDDRVSAGEQLGERLADGSVRPDVVFAVPPGGVRVAEPICERFGADLGLLVAKPIRTPSTASLPVGAVTDTGTSWLDEDRIAAFDLNRAKLEAEQKEAFREARSKHGTYDAVGTAPTPEGTVTLVTEGITSDIRLKACASALGQVEGCYAVAAAPFGIPDAIAELETVADEVVVNETVSESRVHGAFYDCFDTPIVPEYSRHE